MYTVYIDAVSTPIANKHYIQICLHNLAGCKKGDKSLDARIGHNLGRLNHMVASGFYSHG